MPGTAMGRVVVDVSLGDRLARNVALLVTPPNSIASPLTLIPS